MAENTPSPIQVTCPCCGATLTIEAGSAAVTEWKEAQDPRKGLDLKDAQKLLQEEKAHVEERYQEIVKADKERGAAMDKKFQEFFKKVQDQPPDKPIKDIDLD
jgi:DNA-binding transcriptional MerR regulator